MRTPESVATTPETSVIASQLLAPSAVNVPATDADASGDRSPQTTVPDAAHAPEVASEKSAESPRPVALHAAALDATAGDAAPGAGDGVARLALAVDGARCRFHAGAGGWRLVRTLPNQRGGVSVEQDRGPATGTAEAAATFAASVMAAWDRQFTRDRAALITARADWRNGRPGLRPNSSAARQRYQRRAGEFHAWCGEAAIAWRDLCADLVRLGLAAPTVTVPEWVTTELADAAAGRTLPAQEWLLRCGIEVAG